jgi:hypothetical protein
MDKVQVFIWPHCHGIDDDGTIYIKGSEFDAHVRAAMEMIVEPGSADYLFYMWLINHPEYQRVLTEDEVSQARDRFEFESGLGPTPQLSDTPPSSVS